MRIDTRIVGIATTLSLSCMSDGAAAACRTIPATFTAGRVTVDYPVRRGKALRLFTDTGGGASLISRAAAVRLGLDRAAVGGPRGADPSARPETAVVPPPSAAGAMPAMPNPAFVVPGVMPVADWPEQLDGMLGQNWFAGHAWTWDYPGGRLLEGCRGAGTAIPIGLPDPASRGRRQFPRISVTIAGEPVEMLLDSGATTWLTEKRHGSSGTEDQRSARTA